MEMVLFVGFGVAAASVVNHLFVEKGDVQIMVSSDQGRLEALQQ